MLEVGRVLFGVEVLLTALEHERAAIYSSYPSFVISVGSLPQFCLRQLSLHQFLVLYDLLRNFGIFIRVRRFESFRSLVRVLDCSVMWNRLIVLQTLLLLRLILI